MVIENLCKIGLIYYGSFLFWKKNLNRKTKRISHNFYLKVYTNAEMKIYQYLCILMKRICSKFHIETPFTFWDMRTRNMWKVCLQTFRNNRICKKLAYYLRNLKLHRQLTREFLVLRMRNFQAFVFYEHEHIRRSKRITILLDFEKQTKVIFMRAFYSPINLLDLPSRQF